MNMDKVGEIFKLNKDKFKDDKELYDFIDQQIQSHMLEIYDRKSNHDDHYLKEIADLAILARMMALCEGVDDKIFEERYRRFKEKVSE